jgi:simple sugar transport system ATP-binding protein
LLEVRDLSMEGFYKNVNFSLYPGEILGIVGLLGSGRTELALSLFGVKPADNGKILKNGKVIQITSILEAMKNRIGYVPEDRLSEGLFLPQSINWNVGIANLKAYSGRFGKLEKKKMEQVSEEYVKQLDIATDNIDKASKFLSGGNQQKVVISRWLSCNPDIMIFNCPTVGVDIAAKYDIHDILRKLASKNMGIIIISDDIPEVYANCNRIFVMNKGQIIKELENVETSEEELYALMSSNS